MRICIVTGLLIPALAFAETATNNPCPTLVSAAFTTDVENREPVSSLATAALSTNELLSFTAIQGGNGQQLHHTWSYNGDAIVDVTLAVGSDYWRTWSSKTFAGLDLADHADRGFEGNDAVQRAVDGVLDKARRMRRQRPGYKS